jgi:hypothetical protein
MGLFNKLFGSEKNNSDFTPSADLLSEDKFWKIIETSFNNSGGDFGQQKEELSKELHKLPLQDLILFGNRFSQLRGNAYTWELWGAIYIIHGGCGDDSFMDFRDWVISQGKDFYYNTLSNPESLVNIEQNRIDIDWEGMGYIPLSVFAERTQQEIPSEFEENHEISGEEWKEDSDDLKKKFPVLWTKYYGRGG